MERLFVRFMCIVILLSATSVWAGTVTYDSIPASIVSSAFPFAGNLEFPKWDLALHPGQTLTGAEFALRGDIEGSIKLHNNATSEGTFSGTTAVTLTLTLNFGGGNIVIITVPSFGTGNMVLASALNRR